MYVYIYIIPPHHVHLDLCQQVALRGEYGYTDTEIDLDIAIRLNPDIMDSNNTS